jgi:hypothetical protein
MVSLRCDGGGASAKGTVSTSAQEQNSYL